MKRRKSEKDQKLADDARLLRAWRRFHAEELETAMNGTHGSVIARLIEILQALELESGPTLIAFIAARNWELIDVRPGWSFCTRSNRTITRLRTRNGLEPIADPLWGERENVFRTIKAILFPPQAAPTGAHAGHMTMTTTS